MSQNLTEAISAYVSILFTYSRNKCIIGTHCGTRRPPEGSDGQTVPKTFRVNGSDQLDDLLAEISPFEHAEKRLRRGFEPFGDAFAVMQFPVRDEFAELL
jgi:hypothetical protein